MGVACCPVVESVSLQCVDVSKELLIEKVSREAGWGCRCPPNLLHHDTLECCREEAAATGECAEPAEAGTLPDTEVVQQFSSTLQACRVRPTALMGG